MKQMWRLGVERVFALVFSLFFIVFPLATWAEEPILSPVAKESIGVVTLSIGMGTIQRSGQELRVTKGISLFVGDEIKTASNGHVLIQFIDQAKVSVRPDSILKIELYSFNREVPAQSAVKFVLTKGVVRAISGQAAQNAKDRFRLNTPLVAIGVKGTDFTTRVNDRSAIVVVNQGAIVLAPLSQSCVSSGLGPCVASQEAKTLTAQMAGTALVYRQNMASPSFQPIRSLNGSEQLSPTLHLDGAQNSNTNGSGTSSTVSDGKAPNSASSLVGLLTNSSTMVWGRWPTSATPGDDLTVPFVRAMSGREVTVGDGYYFLFRDESQPSLLPGLNGQVNFSLQAKTARYVPNSGVNGLPVPVNVLDGTLGINFSNATFATSLNLDSAVTGPQIINATGTLSTVNGIFLGGNANASGRVAGALSQTGQQAGYLFNKSLPNGSVSGATLWGR